MTQLRGEALDARINDVLSNGLKAYEKTGISFRALAELIGCDPKTLRDKKETLARIQTWRTAHPTPQDRSYRLRINRVVFTIEQLTKDRMIFSVKTLLKRHQLQDSHLTKDGAIKTAYDQYLKVMEVMDVTVAPVVYWPATLPEKEVVIRRVLKHLVHENLTIDRVCRKLGVKPTSTHRESLTHLLQECDQIKVTIIGGNKSSFYLGRRSAA
jgi:hypothetical protein